MNVFSIAIAVAVFFVLLLRLLPRVRELVERGSGQSLDQFGDEHLHVPARRKL